MYGENIAITSPVVAPAIALDVTTPFGTIAATVAGTSPATPQNLISVCRYHLKGLMSATLTVADQGVYKIEFFPRSNS